MLFNPKAVQKTLRNQRSHCPDTDYSNVFNAAYMRWDLLFLVQYPSTLLIKLLYDAAEYRLQFLRAEGTLSPDPAIKSNLFEHLKTKYMFFSSVLGATKESLL